MMQSTFKITLQVVSLILTATSALFAYTEKPNVIIIYADDMGVGDVSHTTGKAPTPHLDRMASEGMRFTDAHSSSAVCTPSRYSILTGRYSWRTRLGQHVFNHPHYKPLIEPGEATIGSILQSEGYHTAFIGKSHLGIKWQLLDDFKETETKKARGGWNIDFSKPATITPTSHGFDYYWGLQASLDMSPYLYIENDTALFTELVVKEGGRSGPMDVDFKFNECLKNLADKSVAYIDERAKVGEPFFLYLPLTSPHSPVVPSPEWAGQSGIGRYGDFLMETDWVVGQVLNALNKNGIDENTLVIFSADNGCSPQSAGIDNLIRNGHYPSGDLRGYKADLYEGGHRVPFIVLWPSVVDPSTETSRLTSQTDLLRTIAEIVDADVADNVGVDSVSFFETLKDASILDRSAIVHHSINGSFAIRSGDWKLLLCSGSGGWSDPTPGNAPEGAPEVQLYNLSQDIGETTNLEAIYPERVEELTQLLLSYVKTGRSTPGEQRENARVVDIGPNPKVRRTLE